LVQIPLAQEHDLTSRAIAIYTSSDCDVDAIEAEPLPTQSGDRRALCQIGNPE